MALRKGEQINVSFTRLSYKGYGIGSYDGREVCVPGALPGEQAQIRVLRIPRHRIVGEVVQRLASPFQRIPPRCSHFGLCGGCWWQDIAYADQLRLKEGIVRRYLASLAEPSVFSPILPSPVYWNYRNKMEFSFDRGKEGEFQLGLHLRGRFDQLFDLRECPLPSPLFTEIVQFIRALAQKHGLPVYNQRTREGLLRFLTIREGVHTGEILVALTATRREEAFQDVADALAAQFPQIRSVLLLVNDGPAQVAFGSEEIVLWGEPTIHEILSVQGTSLTFALSFRSFLQTNTLGAEQLYGIVMDLTHLSGTERVLDIFCGIGTITGFLARRSGEVVGIELIEDAVADARMNMQANGITNVSFIAGPAKKVLREIEGPFDIAVVDPPRAGVHPKALRRLMELAPPCLIYVSCNPKTLSDDLNLLREQYTIQRVQPVDLFPHTPHVETVVSMTSK